MVFDDLIVFDVLVFDGFGELMVFGRADFFDDKQFCRVLSGLTALMSVTVRKVLMNYHDE